ncbi:MAG: cell division protein SepF [Eubacteriales bacterium]|nr:cell division protein SepF [Eubacteriales bacterium]
MANKFVNGFLSAIGMEVNRGDTEEGYEAGQDAVPPAGEPQAQPRAGARASAAAPTYSQPSMTASRAVPATGARTYTPPAGGAGYYGADSRPMQPRPIDTSAGDVGMRSLHNPSAGKVVGMPSSASAGAGIRVVVYQPQSYDDTQRIIDELKAHRAIIINLENLKIDVAQRVLDFISGAVYALDGSVRKISRGIFLVAPSNVDISGNFINNLPSNFQGNTGHFRPVR